MKRKWPPYYVAEETWRRWPWVLYMQFRSGVSTRVASYKTRESAERALAEMLKLAA